MAAAEVAAALSISWASVYLLAPTLYKWAQGPLVNPAWNGTCMAIMGIMGEILPCMWERRQQQRL